MSAVNISTGTHHSACIFGLSVSACVCFASVYVCILRV